MKDIALISSLLLPISALPLDTGSDLKPGQVYAVNEARLSASTFSEGLQAYSVGYKDPEDLAGALEFIAPEIVVPRRFEFKKLKPEEVWLSDIDDIRAIGADFKRVEFTGTSVNEKTHNKGLVYRIDRDEDLISEEAVVGRLQTRLLRNELRRGFAIAIAAASDSAKTWNASAQPDEDMRAACAAAQLAVGMYPNRGVISQTAWNLRKGSYAPQQNAGAVAGYNAKLADVADDLGLDDFRKDRSLFQVSKTAKQQLLVSRVLFYYAMSGIMKDDPSSMKRFVTPPEGGGRFRVYRTEHAKYVDIMVEHYSNVVATAGGIQSLTIS